MHFEDPILITGYNGFIGKNLVARLKATGFHNLMLFGRHDSEAVLQEYVSKAMFVFHLAGVNRPQNANEFYAGNRDLTVTLTRLLTETGRKVPLLVTSSAQAALDNDYGKSKKMAEDAVLHYQSQTESPVFLYRLPGVFGKWCKPNYNSVVATFCHNTANGLPLSVRDPDYELKLVYIDDVIDCFITNMQQLQMPQTSFSEVSITHSITLGNLATTIQSFAEDRRNGYLPHVADGSIEKKLYSTFLSYLPTDQFACALNMHCDDRGSFTEFCHTPNNGQVSVNISKPGIVKGNHWHDTKNEKFLVVKGKGLISFRKIDSDEVIEYYVSDEQLTVVDIPCGYTHCIANIGTEDMVTVMWANENFDPEHPDTYFLKVYENE